MSEAKVKPAPAGGRNQNERADQLANKGMDQVRGRNQNERSDALARRGVELARKGG